MRHTKGNFLTTVYIILNLIQIKFCKLNNEGIAVTDHMMGLTILL